MRRRTRKPHGLKVRRYADILIGLNDYFDSFTEGKPTDQIGRMELNKVLWNNMPNSWINQAFVKVFYCKYITFKKAVNILECMENDEYICEGVVKRSYKTLLVQMRTVMVT